MRVSQSNEHVRVRVIGGTHVVLIALDMDENERKDLRGFAIKRGLKGQPQEWLKGIKYFKDLVQSHEQGDEYSSRKHPFHLMVRLSGLSGYRVRFHYRPALRRSANA
jgi:hypothetical protein